MKSTEAPHNSQTRFDFWRWTPCSKLTQAIPECRWAWRILPKCYEIVIRNITLPILTGLSGTSLLFSRQTLEHQVRSHDKLQSITRGGYILRDCLGTPDVILIATGSEVGLTPK